MRKESTKLPPTSDTIMQWYTGFSEFDEINAETAASAIGISGLKKTIRRGGDIHIPSLDITISGKINGVCENDVQTIVESEFIPYEK